MLNKFRLLAAVQRYRGFFKGKLIYEDEKKIFNRKKIDYYLIYTLAFGIIGLILYLQFYLNGKSLIWSHDGVPQHLNSLAYYGEYLRNILHSVFVEHKFEIPMWDMHIG